MTDTNLDTRMRLTAFEHVRNLNELNGHITHEDLARGFIFEGERIPLVNPHRGIFKSRKMKFLLSIRTVYPKPGGKIWYDDQREVHRQIFEGDEVVDYAFMGTDPNAADNQWLREAMENEIPIIYFLGVAPGRYQAIIPVFIVKWSANTLKASIAFSPHENEELVMPEGAGERRYALHMARKRLHQALFREAVISAYDGCCALSGLPEPRLLDAAHIISDTNEEFGQPIVPNGLLLSKTHHAAFDAHLIGIDRNYGLHVSKQLLDQHDGPMLESLKGLQGEKLSLLPNRKQDWPDPDRLAERFKQFETVA